MGARLEAQVDRFGAAPDTKILETTTLGELLERYQREVSPTKRGSLQEIQRIGRRGGLRISKVGTGIYWTLQRWNKDAGEEIVIDMNAHKGEQDDYLDRTQALKLHETFWIEPAAIIRSMLGV
ncbi:hypothetical protein C7449_103130 [Mycoplana dimorpha]|uniref:Uncharacterized protein n=1 Tax=Mycoplana dimorpha TaxID=28320 RepID=A0A2T5BAX1_MYCDI|nr:hypothetical protein C7449_103130 [Mycoplana dimorpha]